MLRIRKKLSHVIHVLENFKQTVIEVQSSDESTELVAYLNTEKQMYEDSTNADGENMTNIKPYTFYTINIKKAKEQKYDAVTLKDTGDFYKSFVVSASKNGIVIFANTIKEDKNLEDVYGKLTGLNDENLQIYRQFFKEALYSALLASIRKI